MAVSSSTTASLRSTPGFSVQSVPWEELRTVFPTVNGYVKRKYKTRALLVATSKIRYGESPYLGEWLYLRSLVPEGR